MLKTRRPCSIRNRLAALALAIPFVAGAQARGVIHRIEVPGASLVGNRLGDSPVRLVSVYLPPSYSAHPRRRYPVVYLLHGFGADDRAFIRGAYQNLDIRISMDSLVRAGLVHEMIIVTPNARNRFDGSFYSNSPATGNWENFVVSDLIPFIDSHFRTIASRRARGIAGHSMGGFGALLLAARHPELFSAVYALSPYGLSKDDAFGSGRKRAWAAALAMRDTSDIKKAGFNANLFTALAALNTPDTTRPPFFVRFPYRMESDTLVPDSAVIGRWRSPMEEIAEHATDLRREEVAFDAGDADGFPEIPVNVRKLDSLLVSLSVPHSAEIYRGTHGSRIRSRLESVVLPFFSRALDQRAKISRPSDLPE
jgi:S-formylglutathione hydrolase